jgi:hypothetical protein
MVLENYRMAQKDGGSLGNTGILWVAEGLGLPNTSTIPVMVVSTFPVPLNAVHQFSSPSRMHVSPGEQHRTPSSHAMHPGCSHTSPSPKGHTVTPSLVIIPTSSTPTPSSSKSMNSKLATLVFPCWDFLLCFMFS